MTQQRLRVILLFLLCTLNGVSILTAKQISKQFSAPPYYLLLIVTLIATIYLAISKKENTLIDLGSLITAGVSVLIILVLVPFFLDSRGEGGLVVDIVLLFLLPAFYVGSMILLMGLLRPSYPQKKSK